MKLVCDLFFAAAYANFAVFVVHLAGSNNALAHALTRLQVQLFRKLQPTPVSSPDTQVEILAAHANSLVQPRTCGGINEHYASAQGRRVASIEELAGRSTYIKAACLLFPVCSGTMYSVAHMTLV